MTHQQYIIQRKLNIIELSEQLGNISDACRKYNTPQFSDQWLRYRNLV